VTPSRISSWPAAGTTHFLLAHLVPDDVAVTALPAWCSTALP
jgi:hypothetical protein